jgi:PAS domain S-box-containing protein
MPDQRARSLTILALLQAILGALVAIIVFALYGLSPGLLGNASLTLTAAVLGAAVAIYFATLHQIFKKKHLELSTLGLSIFTVMNAILVITATGGLDSPFYSLWLLAIVAAGIFGSFESLTLLGVTIAYYAFSLLNQTAPPTYLKDHLIQFGITLTAAALAEWVHSRNRRASATSKRLETVTGQLTTEQLKAEAIMASIGEGVMVIDGSRKIQLFNKAAQKLTGWDEDSAQGIDYNLVLQLRTSDDQPISELNDPFVESWKKAGEIIKDTLVMTTRGGRKIQLNISISPIFDADNKPSGAIALFRDISEEKEVARQKDEFVSTASHEMRTPVAAIEGYISLAMNANVATIDDRAMKYLTKAHDTIGHLGELFRDLLSVTKAEEGQLGGYIDAVDIGRLAQSSVDDMQFTVKKKNLTLVYQIGDDTGKVIAPLYYVAANPERLREVIMNLIDNAAKFTPEGGIKVILNGNEKEVTIAVSDSGVGIAAEDVSHLFQKFYRIDNSATRTIGGTGLGLYLCRRVIESFNGRIWVESKSGVGSTFKFTLPRLSQAEVDKLHDQVASTAPNSSNIPALIREPSTARPISSPLPGDAIVPLPVPQEVVYPTKPTPVIDATATLNANLAPAARRTTMDISRRLR